jgi:hypothetical protein
LNFKVKGRSQNPKVAPEFHSFQLKKRLTHMSGSADSGQDLTTFKKLSNLNTIWQQSLERAIFAGSRAVTVSPAEP